MTNDPPRLRFERGVEDSLGAALRASLEDVPSREQIAALERRLGIGPGNSASLQPLSRRGRSGTRGLRVALLALAATIGAGAAVTGYRVLQTSASKTSVAPAGSAASVERPPTVKQGSSEEHAVERGPETEAVALPEPSAARGGGRPINEVPVPASSNVVSPRGELPASADLPPVGADDSVAGAAVPRIAGEPESALLGRAQRALGSNPAVALSLAEQHAADYPSGLLSQEREVIAIQALVALHRTAEAGIRAQAFRARYPGSAHLRRVDRVLTPPGVAHEAEPSP